MALASPPLNHKKLEEKLTKYLLNPDHPKGKHKSIVFANMGYGLANWQALAKELKFDITKAVKEELNPFGHQPYTQFIEINSADGSFTRIIQTAWELKKGMKEVDFITAYPAAKNHV